VIKPHQFVTLAAATVVSVLLTVGVYLASNNWSAGRIEGKAFLPELASGINSAGTIEITQGAQKLVIERAGQSWQIKDRGGFPAKTEAARTLDKLGLLELEAPSDKDAKSRGVRVLDGNGRALADIVVGKTRFDAFGSGRGGIYVRKANETQSWLATGDPKITVDIKDWVDTNVFALEADKIAKVTIETPGETALVIEKAPPPPAEAGKPPAPSAARPEKFKISNLAEGQKLKQGAGIDGIVEAFGSIGLEDVRKLASPPTGDGVQVIKVEAAGGPAVTFHLRKDGTASWLSLSASGEGEAKAKADAINAKAKGWEFRIPSWKADQIGKRRADLIETT
jgi:hypothetical protein